VRPDLALAPDDLPVARCQALEAELARGIGAPREAVPIAAREADDVAAPLLARGDDHAARDRSAAAENEVDAAGAGAGIDVQRTEIGGRESGGLHSDVPVAGFAQGQRVSAVLARARFAAWVHLHQARELVHDVAVLRAHGLVQAHLGA